MSRVDESKAILEASGYVVLKASSDEPVEAPELVCFVCGKPTEPVRKDEPQLPYRATLFTTSGHYGSTVFDTMHDRFLQIAICDAHLTECAYRVQLVSPRHVPRPDPTRAVWDPEKDYR